MACEIVISTPISSEELDARPGARHLAEQMVAGGSQHPEADVCIDNFLEVVGQLHTPEAVDFLSFYSAGKVELYVPKVEDESEFGRLAAVEIVPDEAGNVHTEFW